MSEPVPDPSFVTIRPNPFIVGNPVRGRTMFFGREAEFELVRNRFQHASHGGLLVFCGERRSGKTSILFQILDQRLGPDFIPVLIDMQSMAISSEADFLDKIVQVILAAFGSERTRAEPPDFSMVSNQAAAFHRFIEQLMREHPDRKLIMLFDEYELFENKIDSGVLSPDILYMLSSLMEHQSVFIVFTGSQHLEQRRREYWKILGKSIWKQISYLERAEALRLMCEPVEGRVRYGEGTLDAIYRLSAGQPFYTQAVCQSLVDLLNERRSSHVTLQLIGEVADGLVNNPLPQMIFLWDSLEREQKLVLALLAEALPDEHASVGSTALATLIRKRDYPLDLGRGQLATALETSFRSELLSKDDTHQPPTYAFRMDLWRLWIRRMHSLWQVMREEGLEIKSRKGIRIGTLRVRAEWLAAVVVVAIPLGFALWPRAHNDPGRGLGKGSFAATPGAVGFSIDADPSDAAIELDGKLVSRGAFDGGLSPGQHHVFRLSATGYADTTLSVQLAAGQAAEQRKVALRVRLGDLRIETTPPAALITVDGQPRGKSPVTVRDLAVPRPHEVVASLSGWTPRSQTVRVVAGALTPATLSLSNEMTDVVVTSNPPGATVSLDGTSGGGSPYRFERIPVGRHRFAAHLDGYAPADTTVDVGVNTHMVPLVLVPEPPGVLVIQGDKPGQIYLDGTLVGNDVQNSKQTVRRGSHQVHVVLVSGTVVDYTVTVKSGERTTYDYSKGTITRSP